MSEAEFNEESALRADATEEDEEAVEEEKCTRLLASNVVNLSGETYVQSDDGEDDEATAGAA